MPAPSDWLIPATVIGIESFPVWYEKSIGDVAAMPDRVGPIDREEALRDAVLLAIDDPLRAGLGLAREYRRFSELTDAATKMPDPSVFTLAVRGAGGDFHPDRNAVTEALIPIVNVELKAVVTERFNFARLDAPSFARHPDTPNHLLDRVPIQVFEGEARRLPEGVTPRVLRCGERRRSSGERHPGNRHRHVGDENAGHRRAGHDPRLGIGRVSVRPPPPRLVGAGPRALVGGHEEDRRGGAVQGGVQARGHRRDRPERPDARLGLPRRRRQGHSPRLALERPADRRRVREIENKAGGRAQG